MDYKQSDKNYVANKKTFDERGLEQSVIDKTTKDADYEAKMIAQFNAKVNCTEQQEKPDGQSVDSNEQGGPSGLEPTRYGDWERKGRCYDF